MKSIEFLKTVSFIMFGGSIELINIINSKFRVLVALIFIFVFLAISISIALIVYSIVIPCAVIYEIFNWIFYVLRFLILKEEKVIEDE